MATLAGLVRARAELAKVRAQLPQQLHMLDVRVEHWLLDATDDEVAEVVELLTSRNPYERIAARRALNLPRGPAS